MEEEKYLTQKTFHEEMGRFTEDVLLPAIERIFDYKLEEKLESKLEEKLESKFKENLGPIRQRMIEVRGENISDQ